MLLPKKNSGFTLVELMVALGLGLLLMAVVMQVFLGSKRTFDVISAQSHMQENGRFAVGLMARTIRQAGYLADIDPDVLKDKDLAGDLLPADTDFQIIAAVAGENDVASHAFAKDGSDVLHLRMQGDADGMLLNCEGEPLDAGTQTEVAFFVSDANELRCFTNDASPNTVTLVEGVESMQIQYGVNTTLSEFLNAARLVTTVAGAPVRYVSTVGKYVNASDVAAAEWADVVSVRIAILASSDSEALDTANKSFTLLDSAAATYSDGKARQMFTQTITLRNQVLRPDPEA